MSATAGISCLTCREFGPTVGDYGFLGLPGIEPVRVSDASGAEDDTPSFGFLYEGLVAIGLQRFDLDECAQWLRGHVGHRLALDVAGNNEEVAGLQDKDVADKARPLWEGAEGRLKDAIASGAYRSALHQASCADCGEEVASSEPEPFKAFEPRELKAWEAEVFLERWSDVEPWWTYRLYGAVDPDEDYMEQLVAFVEEHAEHGVRIQLEAAS